jgi:PleD family two-component response regulator
VLIYLAIENNYSTNYVVETVALAAEKLETILVVDDMETVLRLCVSILKRANFVVLEATNGDAIKLVAEYVGKQAMVNDYAGFQQAVEDHHLGNAVRSLPF